MSALPALTAEDRAAALEKGHAARRHRAEVKSRVRSGATTAAAVLRDAEADEVLAKMKVFELVTSVPGVGKVRAQQIMTRLGISDDRRLRGLGTNQRQALEHEFAA
jgi:hypothetical protein